MRHRVAMRKLGRPTGHRLALIRNLMTDLLRHERLQTTEPKASELRREVEKLITTARANDLHARRLVAAKLYDEAVQRKLFAEIVPRYATRPGGYTRVVKLLPRRGDGAPMAQIELVQ
jgi:large subunit ribosomal protein L17